MSKYFTFVDRDITIEFFEKDPVRIVLLIGDDADKKLLEMGRKLDAATSFEEGKAALADLIGTENVEAIVSRAKIADTYALVQVANYIIQEYRDGKGKNLLAARAGRKRK